MDDITDLERVTAEWDRLFDRGIQLLENVEKTIQKTPVEDLSEGEREVAQLSMRSLDRRYHGKELAELVGVSLTAIYQAENDGRLPPPELKPDSGGKRKIRVGYTIDQINHMRTVFNTHKQRPPRAITFGMLNLKGGSWKTTVTWLFGQYLAVQGYRVLFIDTDPQASLSFLMGHRPDIEITFENTIGPYILADDETILEQGGDPDSLSYAVRTTHWPNLDIIPSCLELLNIDLLMPAQIDKLKNLQGDDFIPDYIERLRNGIESISDKYDFVLIDGTPSLNISTLNVVTACDVTLVPVPAQMSDFASTLQFVRMIIESTTSIYQGYKYLPPTPELYFGITKFASAHYASWMANVIRKSFEGRVLNNEFRKHDEIGRSCVKLKSIYETNPKDADNRQSLKTALQNYNAVFEEIMESIAYPMMGPATTESSTSINERLKEEGILQ